jgi:hypothetical protein
VVNDIPAGDRKTANLFFTVYLQKEVRREMGFWGLGPAQQKQRVKKLSYK